MPTGWYVGEIGDIGQNVRDSISADNIRSNDNYIALEHMPRKSISISEWTTGDVVTSNKSRFSKGDILFGKLRPYFHKVGLATIEGVCSTDILVCRASSDNLNELLLMILSSDEVVEHATAVSTGTRMPRASWKDLSTYAMAIPSDAVSERFGKYVRPMLEKIEANIPESQYLSNLRDTLLPKLISGELRIKDAEKFLKEAPL
jgi:type I restriction enzyme S subunit